MSECPVRVDVNVSTHFSTPAFDREPGPHAEFKNLSRSNHIEASIDSEIFRQATLIMNGEFGESAARRETRSYNQTTKVNTLVRSKENQTEYMFMPEPNVPPLVLSNAFMERCWAEPFPMTPMEMRNELIRDGIANDLVQADRILRAGIVSEHRALKEAGIPIKLTKSLLRRDYFEFRKHFPNDAKLLTCDDVVEVAKDIQNGLIKRICFEKALLEKADAIRNRK